MCELVRKSGLNFVNFEFFLGLQEHIPFYKMGMYWHFKVIEEETQTIWNKIILRKTERKQTKEQDRVSKHMA